ncbi:MULTISPECIES: M81 family metallopeptidase [unclassified Caballeronia]|uniref:M81 family metallopeptidase n=1 Tax=unclassified Caballeronia TaxID=2646786 RepID=UPI00285B66FF|nr:MULTISPECIES: M81 family metallopeptidase [unclassified Caballeronia]MDR5740988.1 M81 family metallopeptidase [Caballeronia sp. LZ016]MDR5806886.1 M81 family metallopeptidase [Caballeronia sp. LZ019]
MKILIAGFQHETNTFAPTKATYQSFIQGEGFPPMAHGADVLSLRDVNVPVGGFIQWAEAHGHDLLPVIWAGASASAHVTTDAYERIAGVIVDHVRKGGFDAIYLDLHGAMVTEHLNDGEGELLARVRSIVGDAMPLVVSLDLHANVTSRMVELADVLVAYRTYPHVDMAETGLRAGQLLARRIAHGRPFDRAMRRVPFLIPVNGMCTLAEPARGMYAALETLEHDVISLSFAPGFPASDFDECGPVLWGYAPDRQSADRAVDTLYTRLVDEEARWDVPFLSPDEAAREAIGASRDAGGPVIIADTQDNPGVGGDSNTMGMVRALLRNGARDAAVGVIWDEHAAKAAHRAGVGARIRLALGGGSNVPGDSPLEGEFEVEHLSDGRFRFDGPMLNGMTGELGPTACLRIEGVRIAVSSIKMQVFDRNLFRVAGIEPERMKILVNKSSVHFRADFEPIATRILVAKAPGPMAADPADLPWRKLDPRMRVRPMGPTLSALRASAA